MKNVINAALLLAGGGCLYSAYNLASKGSEVWGWFLLAGFVFLGWVAQTVRVESETVTKLEPIKEENSNEEVR